MCGLSLNTSQKHLMWTEHALVTVHMCCGFMDTVRCFSILCCIVRRINYSDSHWVCGYKYCVSTGWQSTPSASLNWTTSLWMSTHVPWSFQAVSLAICYGYPTVSILPPFFFNHTHKHYVHETYELNEDISLIRHYAEAIHIFFSLAILLYY